MISKTIIGNLNNFFLIKDKYFDTKNNTKRKTIKFPAKNLPKVIIQLVKKLKINPNTIKTFKIEESNDKTTQSPHADTPYGQTTIIVPLKFSGKVYTISYKSHYYGNNKKGYKYRPNKKQYYKNEWLSKDHSKVSGITKTKFSKKFYKQYLSDYEIVNLHGLTVSKVFKWKVGKPIQLFSNQLHSGSVFENSKRWIVIHYDHLPRNDR